MSKDVRQMAELFAEEACRSCLLSELHERLFHHFLCLSLVIKRFTMSSLSKNKEKVVNLFEYAVYRVSKRPTLWLNERENKAFTWFTNSRFVCPIFPLSKRPMKCRCLMAAEARRTNLFPTCITTGKSDNIIPEQLPSWLLRAAASYIYGIFKCRADDLLI